ncbi:hypothetical protein QFZ96_004502 [Paraburkholderia youngii]
MTVTIFRCIPKFFVERLWRWTPTSLFVGGNQVSHAAPTRPWLRTSLNENTHSLTLDISRASSPLGDRPVTSGKQAYQRRHTNVRIGRKPAPRHDVGKFPIPSLREAGGREAVEAEGCRTAVSPRRTGAFWPALAHHR